MDLFNIILRPTDLWEYVLHRKLTGGSSLVEVGTSTDPYIFRPSPSFSGATYSKERDKVVGGSVGWNQLVSVGATSVTVQSGHKYYANINSVKSIGSSNGTAITINDGSADNVIDLTQLLGSTIADHAYSLEQSTSGKGVEFVSKLIELTTYHAYDSGSIKSVEGLQSHDMVGFNQWDTSKDNTGKCLNGVGDLATNPNYAVSDYIRTVPNTVYYLKNVAPVIDAISYAEYDIDKVCVNPYGGVTGEHDAHASGTITTGANTAYIRVVRRSTATDYCVNLHGERDGDYKPYVKHSYPLDSTLTLRGVPKLSNGAVYYDGDTYESDGTVTRRFNQITLGGSESWAKDVNTQDMSGNDTSRFYISKSDLIKPSGSVSTRNYIGHMVSNAQVLKGAYVNQYSMTGIEYGVTGYQGDASNYLYVVFNNTINTTVTTVESLKAWLAQHPITVVYELATLTTEQADPYTNPQSVDPYGTEEYVTSGLVAVGHETSYLGKVVNRGLMGSFRPSEEPTEEAND